MLTTLLFSLFYLNINNQFQLGNDVGRNLTAYQNSCQTETMIYLSARDTNGVNLWGVTYLPIMEDSSLDYCFNDSVLPLRTSDPQYAAKKGLSVTTMVDVPEFSTLIAVAPFVDEKCGRAFADQATKDQARVLLFVNDPGNNINNSVMLAAPSTIGALSYSMISVPYSVGLDVFHQMGTYNSNQTFSIPNTGLTNSVARIGVAIGTQSTNNLPRLWISVLAVLAGLLVIFVIMSVVMNVIQLRRRQNLRLRIERGEVNLESLGVRKITVPEEILESLPIRVYKHGEMHFLNQEEREVLHGGEGENDKNKSPSGSTLNAHDDGNTVVKNPENGILQHGSSASTDDISTISQARLDSERNSGKAVNEPTVDNKASTMISDTPVSATTESNNPNTPHSVSHSNDSPNVPNSHDTINTLPSSSHVQNQIENIHEESRNDQTGDKEHIYNQTSCPICLEDFVDGENDIRELPCLHIYHAECVDPFLRTRSSLCPMCKVSVLPPGYMPDTFRLDNRAVRRERIMQQQQQQNNEAGRANNNNNGNNPRRRNGRGRNAEVDENEHRNRERLARHFWGRPFLQTRNNNNNNNDRNSNRNNDQNNGHDLVELDANGNEVRRQGHAHEHAANAHQARANGTEGANDVTGVNGTPRGRRRARINLDMLAPHIEDPVESPLRRLIRVLFPT